MVTLASLTLHRAHCALCSIITLALGLTVLAAGLMPVANGAIAMHPGRPPIGIAPIAATAGEVVMTSQRWHVPRSRLDVATRVPAPNVRLTGDLPGLDSPRGGREFLFEMMRWPRAPVVEITPRTSPTSSSCCPR